jgi:hypothetical protein
MSILFSGDFHANAVNELGLITKKALLKKYGQEKFDGINYHIILGDGGFMWPGNREADLFNYKALARRPFPVLCVIGNHEPILGMSGVPETDIGIGETVYQINDKPFVAYLKRGKVYTIDKIKFLVLGGALSIDKDMRKPNVSWWEREYWTEQEKQDVFKLLETDNSFDCVISHTGPNHINRMMFLNFILGVSDKYRDSVAFLNEDIHGRINFRWWWCGHWHKDEYYFDKKKKREYQYLYKTTKIIDKVKGRLKVYNEYEDVQR